MAVIATTAIIGASMGALNAFSRNRQRNSELTRELQNHGIEQAALDNQAELAQIGLVGEAAAIASNVQLQSLQIEQGAAAAEAEAKVSAAAAGVSGNAVNATVGQASHNAGMAQGTLQVQEQNALNRVNQKSRDIHLSRELGRTQPDIASNSGGLLEIFNAGLSGFLMGR